MSYKSLVKFKFYNFNHKLIYFSLDVLVSVFFKFNLKNKKKFCSVDGSGKKHDIGFYVRNNANAPAAKVIYNVSYILPILGKRFCPYSEILTLTV